MKAGKIIFFSLLGATVLGGAYMVWKRIKKNKEDLGDNGKPTDILSAVKEVVSDATTPSKPSSFPIKFGDKNSDLVGDIQRALRVLYPSPEPLPIFGVDKWYGKETEAALKANGLPTVITKTDYDRIMAAAKSGKPIDPSQTGKGLGAFNFDGSGATITFRNDYL